MEHDPSIDDVAERFADATEERRREDRRLEDEPETGRLLEDSDADDEPDTRL